jgi:hypothetical protein
MSDPTLTDRERDLLRRVKQLEEQRMDLLIELFLMKARDKSPETQVAALASKYGTSPC